MEHVDTRHEVRNPGSTQAGLLLIWNAGSNVSAGRPNVFPNSGTEPTALPASIVRRPAWIDEALRELRLVGQEAREEGVTPPSSRAKRHARLIIERIGISDLPAPSVYPTEDGEIAIFFASSVPEAGVLILCDSKGAGACFSSIGGRNKRVHYSDASEMPGANEYEEFQKLVNWGQIRGIVTSSRQ